MGFVRRNIKHFFYHFWGSSKDVFIALTHWGRDKMATVWQTTLSNAFSRMKMYDFRLRFHFVPKGPISNFPTLVQIMAWRRLGDKPLSEPMFACSPMHICVSRSQCVNGWYGQRGTGKKESGVHITGGNHDDVIKWKHFPHYYPFVRGSHQSLGDFPHKGQWHRMLMFYLICAWTNDWANTRDAGDLRHHRTHYDVIVMCLFVIWHSIKLWLNLN